jgi:P-type Mg2+ transporter
MTRPNLRARMPSITWRDMFKSEPRLVLTTAFAPAIHAAHVGLSVDGATDVARAAADMILLASDLNVLAEGVRKGRRTFANILKYVRMGTSSNFGNMLSMALASLVLPFLPLLPLQILLNNFSYRHI